jgi:PAS domain S-box-containing protein
MKKPGAIKSPLHILHLEDNPNDAQLVERTLAAAGVPCLITRLTTRAAYLEALDGNSFDLILSNYKLPNFDGLSALQICRERSLDMPFILVTKTMDEKRAIESMQNHATDYVMKDRLSRLCPAVRRAMKEVEGRAGNRRTEAALQHSEQRLKILFSESPLGIALVGVDGRPVLTNAAFQKMLGYTGAELSRMPFRDFTHPDDCAKDLELYRQLVEGARKSYQVEKRYLRKDGQEVWARLSVSLAREAAGRAGFAIKMVEDITERRKLETQVIEGQKMEAIGQLAGGVAHDFNNILAVIMGYSDLTMEKLGPDQVLKSHLETIRAAAERATGLTRQLLIFSRKQMVQPVVLDLSDVVKDLDKMLRRLIDENIEMAIVPGNEIGHVKADAGYVGQVLMNLVVNARDAMPNGGKLTIATHNVTLDQNYARTHTGALAGDYVMLSVSDTGTGMTEEVKAHLFEAFFTTKPKGKGTGLGLATCHTIVQLSGGHIGLDSEVGKGTTFRVYFPRVEQPLAAAARPLQTGPLPRGTETLLIVEDEPAVRHLARDVLKAQGYKVLSASNGQEALHAARDHRGAPMRLAITDVIMPLMGGKVMAEWLRTSYPDLKILFTSGYTDDAVIQQGLFEPGVAFLPKPYTPAVLLRKVREMLDAAPEKAPS